MKNITLHLLLTAVLLVFAAACDSGDGENPLGIEGAECYANLTCNPGLSCSGGICVPATARGTLGNPCYANNSCNPGLLCEEGVCVPSSDLEVGTEGGLCYDNGTCNAGLRCEQGLCVAGEIAPGAEGGECYPNDTCDAGLMCLRGVCVTEEIVTGTLNAPCWPNGTCDTGLKCKDNVCVEDEPEAGQKGGECYPNNTCDTGLSCVDGMCKALGALGQECYPNNTCNAGLVCVDAVCEPEPQTDGDEEICDGCRIDDECIAAYSPHPTDACAWCDPEADAFAYSPRREGHVCREAAGPCDQPETCDGASFACPGDGFKPQGFACGDPDETECDLPDTCDGNGVCVTNLKPEGEACGNDAGTECDQPDFCDGAGRCLPNHRPYGFACDNESFGDCDEPDFCDGMGTCLDNLVPAGEACGSDTETECDRPDFCDGFGACQPNYVAADTACGSDQDTSCDNPDTCDGNGVCLNNFEPEGTVCQASSGAMCDADDRCNGRGLCNERYADAGTACNDSDDCTRNDVCDGLGAGVDFCAGETYFCGTGTCNHDDDHCTCPEGYQGDFCTLCAPTWQDNDGDGICLPGCDHPDAPACDPLKAECMDLSGTASCIETTFRDIYARDFLMGSPPDEPGRNSDEGLHQVTISRNLAIMRTEVTQALWREIAIQEGWNQNPSFHASCDQCPVERVNWYEAVAFANAMSRRDGLPECYRLSRCQGIPGSGCGSTSCTGDFSCSVMVNMVHETPYGCPGYRLPTEAEWELLAKGGGGQAFYPTQGHDGAITDEECDDPYLERIGWYCGNAGGVSHEVAGKTATDDGLYDMAGNVREWVWDRYGSYGGDDTDPTGSDMGVNRITRGGGFGDTAARCRAALRRDAPPTDRNHQVGFRLVRTIEPDRDGLDTFSDNCPGVYNPQQTDWDENGVGDMCDDYVFIQPGTFIMGSPDGSCPPDDPDCDTPPPAEPMRDDDETPHLVTLTHPFLISSHEVTQGQWNAIAADWTYDKNMSMPDEPSYMTACGAYCPVDEVSMVQMMLWLNAKSRQDGLPECYRPRHRCDQHYCGDRYYTYVNGYESIYDCPGWRLPTEAEWEYAARAGSYVAFYPSASTDGSMTYFNDGVDPEEFPIDEHLEPIAWYMNNNTVFYENALSCYFCPQSSSCDPNTADISWNCGIRPVGLKEPNAWGLYDVLGNAFEMVWDMEISGEEYGSDPVTDPVVFDSENDSAYRRIRGGGYLADPDMTRCAKRLFGMRPEESSTAVTFRPVRSYYDLKPPVVYGEKSSIKARIRWEWIIPENAVSIRYRVDAGDWQDPGTDTSYTSDPLNFGSHVFEIQARYGERWSPSAMFATFREAFEVGYFEDLKRDLGKTPYDTATAVFNNDVFEISATPEGSVNRILYFMRIGRQYGTDVFELDVRTDDNGRWRVGKAGDDLANAAYLTDLLKQEDVATDDRPFALDVVMDEAEQPDFASLIDVLLYHGHGVNGRPVYLRFDIDRIDNLYQLNNVLENFPLNAVYIKKHVVFNGNEGADVVAFQTQLATLAHAHGVDAFEMYSTTPNLHAHLAYIRHSLGKGALVMLAYGDQYQAQDLTPIACASLRDEVDGFFIASPQGTTSPVTDECHDHVVENNGLVYASAVGQPDENGLTWYGEDNEDVFVTDLTAVGSMPRYGSFGSAPFDLTMLDFNPAENDAVPLYDADPSTQMRGYLVSAVVTFNNLTLADGQQQMIVAKTDSGGFGLSIKGTAATTRLSYSSFLECDNDYDDAEVDIGNLDINRLHWLVGSYSTEDHYFRLWIDGVQVAKRSRSCYMGLNDSPIVLGADPQGTGATRWSFDGAINTAKVLDWEK